MRKLKKRKCTNVEGGALDTTQSSYEKLKARNVMQAEELERVLLSLQLTQQEKKDIETKYKVACKDLQDTQRQKVELASELESMRTQQHQETNIKEDNARLKRSMEACRTQIEGLKASIIIGADAYDGMVAKVADLEQKIQEVKIENANDKVTQRIAERAVCRHFGWSKSTADPVLFHAAVAF